jgi:predicted short-subunit dehydrogenase-like oxidoreductase (DUF2520 family)
VSALRTKVAIVGAGGLARALSRGLASHPGLEVKVASRRPAAAAALARGTRGLLSARRIDEAVVDAAIVVLAVPDRSIASAARELVPMRPSWRGVVVLHAAGAYGPELLAPLGRRAASTGVLHPLAVLGAEGGAALAGAYARIEGQAKAKAAARRLCGLLGLTPLPGAGLQSHRGRGGYHAAASLASNDLVALLAAGQGLLVRRGVPAALALRALIALAEGALKQVRAAGLSGALTGPVARNDRTTLIAQLRVMAKDDPAAAAAHRALSLRLVELALASGRLDEPAARGLRALLRGPRRVPTV